MKPLIIYSLCFLIVTIVGCAQKSHYPTQEIAFVIEHSLLIKPVSDTTYKVIYTSKKHSVLDFNESTSLEKHMLNISIELNKEGVISCITPNKYEKSAITIMSKDSVYHFDQEGSSLHITLNKVEGIPNRINAKGFVFNNVIFSFPEDHSYTAFDFNLNLNEETLFYRKKFNYDGISDKILEEK